MDATGDREDEAVVRMWRYGLRIAVVLAGVSVTGLAVATPARADFATELSGLPARFTAGDPVETVSAVVSSDGNDRCVKVRWSLVLKVRDIRLDQVRVDRVEQDGSFPLEIRTDGAVARLTDRQLDPGTLCPDRTVTARYRLAFAEDVTEGRVTLAAEAYDPDLRLLARQTATRSVVGVAGRPATSRPVPESTEEPDEAGVPTEEPVTGAPPTAAPPPAAGGRQPAAGAGGFGVVQAAFLLGGLLLFLGVGLLLRLRHLTRAAADDGVEPAWERPVASARWGP